MLASISSSVAPVRPALLAAGFVTPAFAIAGLALAAIPVIIHILNRRRFRTVAWAAMEYLLQAMRKNRRRLKFEQWLLLVTRCALLALVGAALAGPLACQDSSLAAVAGRRSGLYVFVIDNSYSMSYRADRPGAATHLDQARKIATQLVDRLSSGGESVALITAAAPATALIVKPSFDLDAAKAAIERIDQSWSGTDLPGALQLALQIGRENSRQSNKVLYLFTDGTRSAWQSPGASTLRQTGPQLAGLYRITHFNLGRQNQTNLAVLDVAPLDNLLTTRLSSNSMRAQLRSFGAAADPLVQWTLDGQPLPGAARMHLQPGPTAQPQVIPNVAIPTGGAHVVSVCVLGDDRLPGDDTRYRVINVASDLKVLVVEGDRGLAALSGSAAYLDLALAPPASAGSSVIGAAAAAPTDSNLTPERISDLELGNKVLSDYKAVILADVPQLQPAQADQLQKYVQQGGALLVFMGDHVRAENYNTVLLPRQLLPGPLGRLVNSPDRPLHFDFSGNPNANLHPLLEAFRGEQNTGLDTAEITGYIQLELPVNTTAQRVLSYVPSSASSAAPVAPDAASAAATPATPVAPGSGDPAITTHALGKGHVVVVTTSADPTWTTLPAKPCYVALIHELLIGSISPDDQWANLTVGQSLALPDSIRLTQAPVLLDPAQRPLVMEQSTDDSGQPVYRSAALQAPGLYRLSTGARTYPVVVNLPDDEADITTLSNAAIKQALGDIDLALDGDQPPPVAASDLHGNDLGWSVMVLVLALAGLECVLAMRFGHYRRGLPHSHPDALRAGAAGATSGATAGAAGNSG